MKQFIVILIALSTIALIGCGESTNPTGDRDISKEQPQPNADLKAGAEAKTIEDWAAANPNNGAPGSGEGADK